MRQDFLPFNDFFYALGVNVNEYLSQVGTNI
mgnify:CR=1 FL=1